MGWGQRHTLSALCVTAKIRQVRDTSISLKHKTQEKIQRKIICHVKKKKTESDVKSYRDNVDKTQGLRRKRCN